MRRLDLIIAAVVILLVAFAVVRQLSQPRETDPGPDHLRIGQILEEDVRLEAMDGRKVRLKAALGKKATILYSWSTTCPCIPYCEKEMHELHAVYGPDAGYAWFGIAGEPTETMDGIRQEMTSLKSFYPMLLDPAHELCRPLGFDRAAMVAILDADGKLVFRGNLGDDLRNPTKIWLEGALEAVSKGEAPDPAETELAYGCVFSTPREPVPTKTPAAP